MALDYEQIRRSSEILADQCVACGCCMQYCPTYMRSEKESESPRGRIMMMKGLLSGNRQLTGSIQIHLDTCLECQACERVCPAQVRYSALLGATRAWYSHKSGKPWVKHRLNRMVSWFGRKQSRTRLLGMLLKYYRISGLSSLFGKMGVFRSLRLIEKSGCFDSGSVLREGVYKAYGNEKGTVGLFTGCLSSTCDANNINAAVNLLRKWGYTVVIPGGQACCGAIDRHDGELEGYIQLARKNDDVFSDHRFNRVIYINSGCGQALNDNSGLIDTITGVSGFSGRMRYENIFSFLWESGIPDCIEILDNDRKFALHVPCSLKSSNNDKDAFVNLLKAILGEDILIDEKAACCGASGLNMINDPGSADYYAQEYLTSLSGEAATDLLTANTGCQMHLNGRAVLGRTFSVQNAVQLLDRFTKTKSQ